MKVRSKNPLVKEMIENLRQKSHSEGAFWEAVARGLNRPRRVGYEVNIASLEKSAKPKETVVVPGAVLSEGELKKPLTVAALRFSARAREKIEKAGGKCLTIQELADKPPKTSRIRILG